MGKIRVKIFVIGLLILLLDSCGSGQEFAQVLSPPGYNLASPVVVHLNADLDEISGISFYAKDTSVFAINDEFGILYKIYLRKKVKIEKWAFSGNTDFEDIVLLDSTFYVLESKGILTWFKFLSPDTMVKDRVKIKLPGDNEFETLYYDNKKGKLIMMCKSCQTDNKHSVSAYSFDPVIKRFSKLPEFLINSLDIAKLLGLEKIRFKPSAAALHPLTGELFIVSGVNKLLVTANTEGKIKQVYKLDPKLFKQPEGLSFTPTGDLLISNESAGIGAGNILIYKYQPSAK